MFQKLKSRDVYTYIYKQQNGDTTDNFSIPNEDDRNISETWYVQPVILIATNAQKFPFTFLFRSRNRRNLCCPHSHVTRLVFSSCNHMDQSKTISFIVPFIWFLINLVPLKNRGRITHIISDINAHLYTFVQQYSQAFPPFLVLTSHQ